MSITAANSSFAELSSLLSSWVPECGTLIDRCYERIKSHETLFANTLEEVISAESGPLSPEKQAMLHRYVGSGLRHVAQVVVISLEAQDMQTKTRLPAKEKSRKQAEATVIKKSRFSLKDTARSVLKTKVRARVTREPQAVQEPPPKPAPPAHLDHPARPVQKGKRGLKVPSGPHERVPFSNRKLKRSSAHGPPTSLTGSFYFPSTHDKYKEFYGSADSDTDSDTDSERQNQSNGSSPSTVKADTPAVTCTDAADVEQDTDGGVPNECLSPESRSILPPIPLHHTINQNVEEVVKLVGNCQNTQKKSTQGTLSQSSSSTLSGSRKRGRTNDDIGDRAESDIKLRPTKRLKTC